MRMFEQDPQLQEVRVVAVCRSEASADLLAMALQIQGVTAHAAFSRNPYPSLDWVEGYRVNVGEDELERALEALRGLDLADDVVVVRGGA